VCKFLAGAFFVSAGTLFYLYLAGVSVPLLGTGFTATPEVSGVRSVADLVLFLTFFYLGFIRKWKKPFDRLNGDDRASTPTTFGAVHWLGYASCRWVLSLCVHIGPD
jgi:hypothetical protein